MKTAENRFNKFSNNAKKKDEDIIEANDILNAGKNTSESEESAANIIMQHKIPKPPKSKSKSYYMRADIHDKLVEVAKGNDLGPSETLEIILKQFFKID